MIYEPAHLRIRSFVLKTQINCYVDLDFRFLYRSDVESTRIRIFDTAKHQEITEL